MTKKEPMKSGDSMDIKHISSLMPYSDMFITDRAMKNFISKRGFDALYNTIVCYIGDTQFIDDFFARL